MRVVDAVGTHPCFDLASREEGAVLCCQQPGPRWYRRATTSPQMLLRSDHLPSLQAVRFEGFGEGSIFAAMKALVHVQFACSVVVVAVDLLLAFEDHSLRGREWHETTIDYQVNVSSHDFIVTSTKGLRSSQRARAGSFKQEGEEVTTITWSGMMDFSTC